jgi:hypothetical protein
MPKNAAAVLENMRQTLINKLLNRRKEIDEQLKGLGYDDKKAAS